jgi:DNA-binding GntR family transcriptional regulator
MTTDTLVIDDAGEPGLGFRSLADHAYEQLRTSILNSVLEPGTALSVPALARTMNISRSPVREAVQRLIHEGLATHVPNVGAEVARLAIEELVEIYVVKEPLAGLASRLAAPRLTETDVDKLKSMMDEQESALTGEVAESVFMAMDLEFHSFISSCAGNATLANAIDQYASKTTLAFPSAWSNPTYARLSVEEHRAITDALVSGDADGAERTTCLHVRNVRVRLARWHAARPVAGSPAPISRLRPAR